MWFCVAGAKEASPFQKWVKKWGFCGISKNNGRCGTFQEDLQRFIWRGFAVQETCSSEMLGGQGADVLRGVAWWRIRPSGFLRRFCATGAAPGMTWHHLQHFTQIKWKNRKAHWYKARTQLSMFEGSLAELLCFWCCQLRKIEDVSQNCFAFWTLSNSKNWGGLAELLRFWCCQVQKLRKSSAELQLHLQLHYTTLHYTALLALHYATLHYTTLH